jgi:multidrug transporter EmrE-like cation transporter
MLQAHSLLWHYLWVAPNFLLLVLAFFLWKRGVRRQFPSFFAYAILSAIGELAVYAADVLPFVAPENFWRVDWASLILEGVLKFVLIGEIFAQVFGSYSYLAHLGKVLIRAVGVFLVLGAAVAAAYAPKYELVRIVAGANLLEQSTYLIESGVLVFIFLFASYFHLRWSRPIFGITLGLGISACVHLATWAVFANGELPRSEKVILVFLNMATYHVCVLIWFYYLLVPQKVATKSAVAMPEHNLEVWNRELERLIHQ